MNIDLSNRLDRIEADYGANDASWRQHENENFVYFASIRELATKAIRREEGPAYMVRAVNQAVSNVGRSAQKSGLLQEVFKQAKEDLEAFSEILLDLCLNDAEKEMIKAKSLIREGMDVSEIMTAIQMIKIKLKYLNENDPRVVRLNDDLSQYWQDSLEMVLQGSPVAEEFIQIVIQCMLLGGAKVYIPSEERTIIIDNCRSGRETNSDPSITELAHLVIERKAEMTFG